MTHNEKKACILANYTKVQKKTLNFILFADVYLKNLEVDPAIYRNLEASKPMGKNENKKVKINSDED